MIPFIFDGGETMRDGNAHLSGEKRKEGKKRGGGDVSASSDDGQPRRPAQHCSHVLRVTEQLCMAERRDMAKEARNVTEKRLVILTATDGTTNADHLGDCGNLRA
jgi:hypothetical protein